MTNYHLNRIWRELVYLTRILSPMNEHGSLWTLYIKKKKTLCFSESMPQRITTCGYLILVLQPRIFQYFSAVTLQKQMTKSSDEKK